MAYLDEIDPAASKIGAVNTIKFLENGKIKALIPTIGALDGRLKNGMLSMKLLLKKH
jgi:hypothetical protein